MTHARHLAARTWPDAFVGGAICLDFINTVESPNTPKFVDRLSSYATLLTWGLARGNLTPAAAAKLARLAKRRPPQAARVWRDGLRLREDLYRLVSSIETGKAPAPLIARLNARLAALPPLPPLAATTHGGFLHALPGADLREPLWPVLWSVAGLLTSDQLQRLGHCHASPCRYVFIDLSRNKSRQWCSSSGCGNRVRVRRAYVAKAPRSRAPRRPDPRSAQRTSNSSDRR
jgi:predicted RNA-binding Zn ribbon-like protein